MKQKLFALIGILFVLYNDANAQKHFYSRDKQIVLSEDTNTIIIKGKQKTTYMRIATLLKDKIILFDSMSLKDIALIKFNSTSVKYENLKLLKSDTGILYISNYLKGGNIPYITTGEILLTPKSGTLISTLLNNLNLANKIQSTSTAFDITVLKTIEGEDVFAIANKIYESGQVKWCHPNFFVPIEHFTNDPLYSQQFYLKNTGQGGGTAGIDINVEPAWNITKGNPNIKIAVIDDGVEDHEDLSGRVLNGFTPRDQTNGNGRPTNSGKHGEACAGIIGASQDNNIGITGIAPNCKIVPVNIFYGGETTLDIANAINWAWNQGQADVLSNSWGYGTSSQTETGFDVIIQAINNARTQGRNGKGSIVVFASGNGSSSVSFPANVQDVITVGAIQKTGSLWGYSNTGPEMDVVAVSGNVNLLGDITTTDRMGSLGYESGNYTGRFGGTSAACPQVSGVAALILSVNSILTEYQVRNIIQSTATDIGASGFDNSYGYGRVNACSAVSKALIISGDKSFCTTSNNYLIPNLPVGASVTWSATPNNIVNINCTTCQQTTLSKSGNGIISLTATISNVCSGQITVVMNNIIVGTPIPKIQSVTYYGNEAGLIAFFIPYCSYNWYEGGVLTETGSGNTYSTTVPCNTTKFIQAEAVNGCGTSIKAGKGLSVKCNSGGSYLVAPNPANSDVTISVNDSEEKSNILINTEIQEVRITDKSGYIKTSSKYRKGTKSVKINTAYFKSDVYIVYIFNGKEWSSQKLLIQH